ncbi:hypothetical protein DSO57_1015085 [Entomophthora muscae]|uniref:Uncharacterized protein n=1 Tax=Entomophthora muscae TaxID=34485 RepID=A0ACC2T5B9_9FUNG|nr:hypothetical protein DSO57_1015085 [Entomophthora muscae]
MKQTGWMESVAEVKLEEGLNSPRRKAPEAMRLKMSNIFGTTENADGSWAPEDSLSPTFSITSHQSSSTQESLLSVRRSSAASLEAKSHMRSLSDCPSPSSMTTFVKSLRSKASLTGLTNLFRPLRSPSCVEASIFLEVDDALPSQSRFEPMQPPTSYIERGPLPREELIAAHTFWILRLIRQSVFTGAHLTERLFIPPTLWHVTRARVVPRMAAKAQHLQWLTSHLDNMADCDLSRTRQVRIQLDLLDTVVHMIQSNQPKDEHLSVKSVTNIMKCLVNKDKPRRGSLPEIFDAPPSTGMSASFSVEDYSLAIINFVDSCQTLEDMYHHYLWKSNTNCPPSLKHGLYRATAFLSHTVVTFLLEDITSLLAVYVEGMTNDINSQ